MYAESLTGLFCVLSAGPVQAMIDTPSSVYVFFSENKSLC